MGYVFLIPGFVFLGCFLVFPFFKSLVRSFTDWNAFSPDFSFVGLKNYIELFHNDEYWAAIKVNLVFAVVYSVIVSHIISSLNISTVIQYQTSVDFCLHLQYII